MKESTAIFGRVEITEAFDSELEARAAGYYYDAHVYLINDFGGIEPVDYKVLAKSTGETTWQFAKIMFDPGGAPGGMAKC